MSQSRNDKAFQNKWGINNEIKNYYFWNQFIAVGHKKKDRGSFEDTYSMVLRDIKNAFGIQRESYTKDATTPLFNEAPKKVNPSFAEIGIWTEFNVAMVFSEYLEEYDKQYPYQVSAEYEKIIRTVIGEFVNCINELIDTVNAANLLNEQKQINPGCKLTLSSIVDDVKAKYAKYQDEKFRGTKKPIEPLEVKKSPSTFHDIIDKLHKTIFSYFDIKKTRIVNGLFGGKEVTANFGGGSQHAKVSYHASLMLNEISKLNNSDNNTDNQKEKEKKALRHIAGLSCKASANNPTNRTNETKYFYQSVENIIDPIQSLQNIQKAIISHAYEEIDSSKKWELCSLNCLREEIDTGKGSRNGAVGSTMVGVPHYIKKIWDCLKENYRYFNPQYFEGQNFGNDNDRENARLALRKVLNIALVDSQAKISDRFFRGKNTQHFYENITDHLVLVSPSEADVLIDGVKREEEKNGFKP